MRKVKMTDEQKKTENLLVQALEQETKAIGNTDNIAPIALALIELWKVTKKITIL